MGNQEIVRDSNGNATHIRETSDDGRKSELFEIDNGLASIFTEDHRGERVEVADHYKNGKTVAYEADNSLFGNLLSGGRGNVKGPPNRQLEEIVQVSGNDDSEEDTFEMTEERIEEFYSILLDELREEREREERLREEREREERLREERRIEEKRKEKIYGPGDRLYSLNKGELSLKASYSNPNVGERDLAILVKICKEPSELLPEIIWGDILKQEPTDARDHIHLKAWKEQIKQELEKRENEHKRILSACEENRYQFIKEHPNHPYSFELSATIERKEYLYDLLNTGIVVNTNAIYEKLDNMQKKEREDQFHENVVEMLRSPFTLFSNFTSFLYRTITKNK